MVQTVNLKKTFGVRVLFQEINLKLDAGKRYGLIGANGAGKTTFLKILSGQEDATEGEIQVQNGKKIGTLSQNQFAYEEHTIFDTVLLGNKRLHDAIKEKERLYLEEYTDEIGELVADMGFKGMLTEGAKNVLGWKSPHFVYNCNRDPHLKLLLRDYSLSEDISFRFNDSSWSEYPLFADTYADWIANLPEEDQVINLFMELCALGIFQPLSSNILDFMKALPDLCKQRGIIFSTPSEICSKIKSAGDLNVSYPISWVDEERDMSPWLGNVMQREAFNKLYSVADRVRICTDRRIKQDWDYLQASNNLRFMSTKPNSYGSYRGIYDSPYDAFTNFMNILGDFITRVNNLYPADMDNEELNSLLTTIKNKEEELEIKDKELAKLQHMLAKLQPSDEGKTTTSKKKTVKKVSVQ